MSAVVSLVDRAAGRVNGRVAAVAVVLLLVVAALVVFLGGTESKTLTAHFSRAVAVYPGSEVRLMGVRIGAVTAVVPEGDSVRVEMTYDATYRLPADAKAAIVTPTLVADRYVQVGPAYDAGKVLPSGADIPLESTGTPVELDRIYRSLANLSAALGPNGANKDGALSDLLSSGADALRGQGALANKALIGLSETVQVFGRNSGPLFDSVRQLSELTGTLAANDAVVNAFMADLSGVSVQLAAERTDLSKALGSLAEVVSTVQAFVRTNRAALRDDVAGLSSVLGTLAGEHEALATALQLAPLGLNNLARAWDKKSGSIGSRVQFGPTFQSLGNVLCDIVVNAHVLNPKLACQILKVLTAPLARKGSAAPVARLPGIEATSDPAAGSGLRGLLGGLG